MIRYPALSSSRMQSYYRYYYCGHQYEYQKPALARTDEASKQSQYNLSAQEAITK